MKSKSLIILAIVVALLVGSSYLFFQISGASQPSLSAKAPSPQQKSPVAKAPGSSPTLKVTSLVATNPSTSPRPSKNGKRNPRQVPGIPASGLITSQLLYEGFEGGVIPPTNWTVVVNNPYTWEIGTYSPYEGAYNAVCYYDQDYTGTQDEWLISPVINLTTKGQAWHLYFYWMMSYYWAVSPYNNYNLEVWISTDGGTTWSTELWSEDGVGVFSNWTWYKADVNLAAYLTETNVKLGFRYYGYDGAEADVDYITVDTEPIGRCCYGDPYNPTCADVTPSACSGLGGTFTDGLNCTDNPCPIAGVGENCATAIAISSLPYNTTGNSCAYVNDYDETCPYSGSAAPDVVYSYSPATDQAINIDLCNSLYDTKVFVYEDVCPSSPFYACNDDACGSDGYKSAIYGLSVYAGHTYYIVVDGYGSGCGDYDLRITEAGAAPPNDQCTGAVPVSAPDCPTVVTVSGTTIGATIDCPGVLDWNAVWYSFYLPYASNKLTIDYCPTAIPIYQIGVVLYNSCPPNCSNYILASAYQFVTCPNSNTGPQMWWSGLPAGTYYLPVAVWDYSMNPFNDFAFTACVEELAAPENDNCANATPVGDVTNLAFSTEAASFDGPGSCQTAPNIWYCYTATCNGNAYVNVCNSYYDTKIAAYEGCSCPPGAYLACNDDACGGTLQSEISFPVVQGNQYLIEVGGYSTATGSGFLSISCALPPPNDECTGAPVINTFPQTVYGTTVGASVDCPGILDWNAVWYQFDVPYACNNITVDYCPTDWSIGTIGIVLYNSCPPDCPSYIVASGYQFVSCANGTTNPQMWWYNLPGPASYWIPVYPFAAANFGFTVYVDSCVPCDVVCPPEGIPEGEPDCYDDYVDNYNGGCNSSPYIWQNINCNTTICGKSGTYLFTGLQYRDTDWFRVEAGDGNLTFKCVAEFPLQTILLGAGSEDCVDYTVIDYRQVNMCDTATITYYVTAGVYWLWVGPSVFAGYPCGLEYVMQVECTGFGPQITVTPSGFNPVLNPTGACSSATENLIISSVGGADLNWSIAENPPVAWLDVSPTSGTLPPGQQATLNVSFDAGGMTPGDYYTNLDITSNAPKGVMTVPVHLKVESAPEIGVPVRLWVPVIPGCTTTQGLRVDNLGTGDLRFAVQVKKNPPPAGKLADVLLVDDDNSINYPGDFTDVQSYFTNALTDNGYSYDIFEVNSIGGDGPAAATMANYPVVIWFTGEAWQLNQTLTPNDEANLATYLNGGGNLFLSAHDYFYDRYPSAGSFSPGQFPYDYLGVTYVTQDMWIIVAPSTGSCVGMAGSVADGMAFDLWDPYTVKGPGSRGLVLGPDDGLYIDELTHNGIDLFQMTNPSPTGIAACQYEGAGFKTVFTTVDFAGLTDGVSPSTKDEFMASVLNWLVGGGCPVTVAPAADTVPPASYTDVSLTFDGSVFDTCGSDTVTCYLVFTSNDCDETQVTVPVYMWSARGEVTHDCVINIADVVYLLNYIFVNGPAPYPFCMGDAEVPHDGDVDSNDALYLMSYLFMYGPPPEMPSSPDAAPR